MLQGQTDREGRGNSRSEPKRSRLALNWVVLEISTEPTLCWSRALSRTLLSLGWVCLKRCPFACAPMGKV